MGRRLALALPQGGGKGAAGEALPPRGRSPRAPREAGGAAAPAAPRGAASGGAGPLQREAGAGHPDLFSGEGRAGRWRRGRRTRGRFPPPFSAGREAKRPRARDGPGGGKQIAALRRAGMRMAGALARVCADEPGRSEEGGRRWRL